MPLNPDGVGDPTDQAPALDSPLPVSAPTEAVGVHQTDVIVRSALIAGLSDLRANPQLLDYAFASLPRDPLTAQEYGAPEVDRAKEWFLSTDIRVFINVNPNEVKFPCVSIALQSSAEQDAEGTLSDTHYQPYEDRDVEWAVLFGPFTPTAYDPETGKLTYNSNDLNVAVLAPGMAVVTQNGTVYTILAVNDQDLTVDSGAQYADLRNAVVKGPRPSLTVEVESAVFREVFQLGCHVDSEPNHLTYLHSLVIFTLLRYRQALLEARGFERASVSSSDFKRDDETLPETIYSRYVTVTGTVRQAWPKAVLPKITTTLTVPSFSQASRQ